MAGRNLIAADLPVRQHLLCLDDEVHPVGCAIGDDPEAVCEVLYFGFVNFLIYFGLIYFDFDVFVGRR